MNLDNHFYLGKITKLFGFKGELIFYLDVDAPMNYSELEMVFVKRKSSLIPYFFEKFEHRKDANFRVKLEGVDDEEGAKSIVNAELYLPLSVLPELTGKQFYFHEVIGYQIFDQEDLNLGTVKRVIDLPTNPLLEVYSETLGEILVPISDDFILKVDRESQLIQVQLPEGFTDLFV